MGNNAVPKRRAREKVEVGQAVSGGKTSKNHLSDQSRSPRHCSRCIKQWVPEMFRSCAVLLWVGSSVSHHN